MFGKLLGNLIAAPVRLINIPIKIMDEITDPMPSSQRFKDRDPMGLDEVADAIADACDLEGDD